LSSNEISKVQGTIKCQKLTNIDLSRNRLQTVDDLCELQYNENIGTINLQENRVEYSQEMLDLFKEFKAMKVIQLKGNPFTKACENYRKRMTNDLPLLTFLDDRPVNIVDKRRAVAFFKGGIAAERAEQQLIQEEKH